MKIIGISGSSTNKTTNKMLKTVLNATGKDYELILLKDKNIKFCSNCRGCHKLSRCVTKDDAQEILEKLENADAIVLGSPTYFDNVSGIMKNFMDRCLPIYFSRKLEGKKVALVSIGNFHDQLELDEQGKCKWHKEETESVAKCISAMENFCSIMGARVVGSVFAVHEDPDSVKDELIELGNELVKSNA